MKPVTIDKLDIKDHIRWAQDRAIHDTSIVKESKEIAAHPDISGTSAIFPSHLEELLAWERGMLPWASFSPPENHILFHKRLFSYRLFPHISSEEDGESEKQEREEEDDDDLEEKVLKKAKNLIEHVIAIQQDARDSLFEKDKNSILTLLESIRFIDGMLAQIMSRKLQYQKG
jgi:hypothetical protein